MSSPKQVGQIRSNLADLKSSIVSAVQRIRDAKDERAESNAVIAEAIAAMEAKGIPRKAIQWAMSYSEWDSDARAGFDAAYSIVREAIGVPMADEMFDDEGNPNLNIPAIADEVEKHAAKGKKTQAEDIAEHVLGQPTTH